MKWLAKRKAWSYMAIVTVVGGIFWWSESVSLGIKQFKLSKTMSEEMFETNVAENACFGRMVLELPKDATLQGSLYRYPGAYREIEIMPNVAMEQFKSNVHAFEVNLRNTKHEKDVSLLRSIEETLSGDKVFVHWQNDFAEYAMDVTAFAWRDGFQYIFNSRVDIDKSAMVAQKALKLLENLQNRMNGDIPDRHGFCLDNAFISDDLKGEGLERAEVSFKVEPWMGVYISAQTFVNQVKEPASLLQRLESARHQAEFSQNYYLIRSGKRKVGEFHGEEVLALVTERDRRYFHFVWEVEGEIRRNDPPDIKLELHVAQDGNSGEMTKEQALGLWEYLLPRLRLRPVNKQTAVSDVRILAPLGERHVTGRPCPQTGWWECDDDLPLAQSKGVWLQEGQRMPMARVWAQPSLWQQFKGERPVGQRSAVWRLAAYEKPAEAGTDGNAPGAH
jgi:hypothetical protein